MQNVKIAIIYLTLIVFFSGCVNNPDFRQSPLVVDGCRCGYKFSNSEMIEKYKKFMLKYTNGRIMEEFSDKDFSINLSGCNYYVNYVINPPVAGGETTLIFDANGNFVAAVRGM